MFTESLREAVAAEFVKVACSSLVARELTLTEKALVDAAFHMGVSRGRQQGAVDPALADQLWPPSLMKLGIAHERALGKIPPAGSVAPEPGASDTDPGAP